MVARAIASRSGPPSATLARTVAVTGGSATLAVLIEVWGAGAERATIEAELGRRLLDAFGAASGSTTARLRTGLQAVHRQLADVRDGRPDLPALGAGASALVITDREFILAQVGPALAFRSAGDGVERLPDASPWLRRGVAALADDPLWPPLGLGREVAVHWSHWSAAPGAAALLVPSQVVGALDRSAVTALFQADPRCIASALAGALGDGTPAIHLALPGPSTRTAATSPPARTSGEPVTTRTTATAATRAPSAAVLRQALPRQIPPASVLARRVAVRGARVSAQVLRALLPERTGPNAYRTEWVRLMALAVLALPLLAVLLAAAMRVQGGGAPAETLRAPAASGTDAVAVATSNGEDGTVRLAPPTLVALRGDAGDERHLVAVGGMPYVLDTETDQVDAVEGDTTRQVLERGQVVGQDTVAELYDLFWLPAPDGGPAGRVVALDAAGRMWAVSGGTVTRIARNEVPGWIDVRRVAGYSGNLYALDRSTGQIVRSDTDTGAFPTYSQPGVNWLKTPETLTDAVDLGVDGSIQVLFKDGHLRRFTSGVADATVPLDPRAATTDARAVYTSPTAGRLLVADHAGGRVVVLSPDGTYQTQLLQAAQALSTDKVAREGRFATLHDVWWDEAGAKLYIVDGNLLTSTVYR